MTDQHPPPLPPRPLGPSGPPQPASGLPPAVPPPSVPPPEPPSRRRRHTVLAVAASVVAVLVAVVIVAGFVIRLPKVIISPGSATPLDEHVVQIKGAPTYPHTSGNLRFLTVRVSNREPTLWRVVGAWLDDDQDVVDRTAVQGCLTDAENQQFNSDLMDQSQNDAKYVALTRLGYSVRANPLQIRVVEVCRDAPAHGKLQTGDQVLAVDGQPVATPADVGRLVRVHHPGDAVSITFDRGGTSRTVAIAAGRFAADGRTCVPARDSGAAPAPTSTSTPGGSGAGPTSGTVCLGVSSQEFVTYHFPIEVNIDTQLVGGPSAGLAFTLAIIDQLTPGSLTGGAPVAVTGTVAPDGSVGEVGGVEQKAITARTNGVHMMIVPKSEVADARRGAGDVRVVGVDDLDDALAALHRAGGAEVPPPSTTAARS